MRFWKGQTDKGKSSAVQPETTRTSLDDRIRLGNYEERMRVLDEIRDSKNEQGIEILSWLMHNGSAHSGELTKFDERAIAAGVLGEIGGAQALRALEGASKVPGLETEVQYAITEIMKKSENKGLLKGLESAQPAPYLTLLIKNRDGAGVSKAMELLDSSDITTAVFAAQYLGVVKCEGAVGKLIDMMKSRYIDYQHAAGVALGRIGGDKAREALFSSLNAQSDWAISGAVKGLAIMFSDGEADIQARVQVLDVPRLRRASECVCSKDDGEEKSAHSVAVNKLLG